MIEIDVLCNGDEIRPEGAGFVERRAAARRKSSSKYLLNEVVDFGAALAADDPTRCPGAAFAQVKPLAKGAVHCARVAEIYRREIAVVAEAIVGRIRID